MSIQRFGKWDFRAVDAGPASRALARLKEQGAPAEPERAAAVVLLREAPLRVFLLRHAAKEPFGASAANQGRGVLSSPARGALAIGRDDLPGATVRERWTHLDVDGFDGPGRAPKGALYGFPGGRHKPDDPDVAMTGVRAVEEETGAMVALQRAWARWVTPEYEPVRFDSWVYVATLAEGFQPRIRVREPEYATWIGPEQAVCQYGGQMSMPEAITLAELSRYSTVGEVFAAAEQREMTPILPRVDFARDGARLVLPGEEGYPADALTDVLPRALSIESASRRKPRSGFDHWTSARTTANPCFR